MLWKTITEFWHDRRDWLRITVERGPEGGYVVALVVDGYYANKDDAERIAARFAEDLHVPLGHATRPRDEPPFRVAR